VEQKGRSMCSGRCGLAASASARPLEKGALPGTGRNWDPVKIIPYPRIGDSSQSEEEERGGRALKRKGLAAFPSPRSVRDLFRSWGVAEGERGGRIALV